MWWVLGAFVLALFSVFFFNDTATTEIYTLSLHDALPIYRTRERFAGEILRVQLLRNLHQLARAADVRSEEHTSELQSQSNLVCRLLLEKKKSMAGVPRRYAAGALGKGCVDRHRLAGGAAP